ncbi:phage terminase small subunit [Mycobacterium intracellulare]|uniref:Terminase small subunit n=1 Tax=Mycobacterium intracellulare TaxID=1767 RepID=A0AAE4UCH5_MYCIT|nr:hypothetical protein [Mycobacterium intracellulare]MDV6975320.1 hypothetical protein [Mycobacterium intracellulare]MDV6980384.1 hypothetical protein [Mycobacterium intracellulare]MDV7010813.1 hypothetical protein [Mycobacterium intracellulare]MDV7025719.1 hypothetical protein [Mycobacterium intracellulare]
MPGPVPQRSDQKVRRNTDGGEIDKITAIGPVEIPDLNIPDAHPFVTELYESMKKSAQKKYYEPTDWAYAKTTLHFLNKLLWSPKPSAQMLASVNQMLTSLLLTEGERRRVRIEVERNPIGGENSVVQVADLFRQRLAQG